MPANILISWTYVNQTLSLPRVFWSCMKMHRGRPLCQIHFLTLWRPTFRLWRASDRPHLPLEFTVGPRHYNRPLLGRLMLEKRTLCQSALHIHKPTLETIAENVAQLEEQKRTTFAPLSETPVVQLASGVAHSNPLTQCNELITSKNQREDVGAHVGVKYMGRAFEKLDFSDGLHVQDVKNDGRDYVSDHFNLKNKGLNTQLVQSQHARQCLRMSVQSASTGHPSVTENTFSSCDINSLASDWSINSWSTFNTQDEQNFRDGLAALDASIESLQKTLRVDLKK